MQDFWKCKRDRHLVGGESVCHMHSAHGKKKFFFKLPLGLDAPVLIYCYIAFSLAYTYKDTNTVCFLDDCQALEIWLNSCFAKWKMESDM